MVDGPHPSRFCRTIRLCAIIVSCLPSPRSPSSLGDKLTIPIAIHNHVIPWGNLGGTSLRNAGTGIFRSPNITNSSTSLRLRPRERSEPHGFGCGRRQQPKSPRPSFFYYIEQDFVSTYGSLSLLQVDATNTRKRDSRHRRRKTRRGAVLCHTISNVPSPHLGSVHPNLGLIVMGA